MRRYIVVAIALALGAVVAVQIVGGARDGSPAGTAEIGGDGPPPREGRRQITPGRYEAPVFADPGAHARGERAQRDDLARPAFEGRVNGIQLWVDTPPGQDGMPCPEGRRRLVPEDEQRSSPHYIEVPSYLPPGAVEYQEPSMIACADRVIHAGRVFELEASGIEIGISRTVGRFSARIGYASAERVEAGSVAGKPAAFVKPVTPEGFGTSWIFVREDWGLTGVTAFDLPFEELLKVAEGVVSDARS